MVDFKYGIVDIEDKESVLNLRNTLLSVAQELEEEIEKEIAPTRNRIRRLRKTAYHLESIWKDFDQQF
jgi:hypothetical protein